MAEEYPTKPERWLAVVPLAERHCGFEDCESVVSAVQTMFGDAGDEGTAYGATWACSAHEDLLDHAQELMPTCRVGTTGSPCGAAASHVAFAGVRADDRTPWIRAVSVCNRHGESLGSKIH